MCISVSLHIWTSPGYVVIRYVGDKLVDLIDGYKFFYVKLSAILDIPVYKNKLHSLHVLFTLYYEFKNSQVRYLLDHQQPIVSPHVAIQHNQLRLLASEPAIFFYLIGTLIIHVDKATQ